MTKQQSDYAPSEDSDQPGRMLSCSGSYLQGRNFFAKITSSTTNIPNVTKEENTNIYCSELTLHRKTTITGKPQYAILLVLSWGGSNRCRGDFVWLRMHSITASGKDLARQITMSHDMTKPTKWVCAQRRLRSAWASAQSDQSLLCAQVTIMILHFWTDRSGQAV